MGIMTLYITMSCWGPILAKHISFTATLKNMARCQIGDQSFQSKYRQDTAPAYRSSPSKHDTYGEANFGKVTWPKNKRKLILHPWCLRCYVAKFREGCGSWKGERPWVTNYTSKYIWFKHSKTILKTPLPTPDLAKIVSYLNMFTSFGWDIALFVEFIGLFGYNHTKPTIGKHTNKTTWKPWAMMKCQAIVNSLFQVLHWATMWFMMDNFSSNRKSTLYEKPQQPYNHIAPWKLTK